jgi:hypothetical protein
VATAGHSGRGHWEADALRDIVRDYAFETLADPDAVLVLDETVATAPALIRWSIQEIRRVATRLARARIEPSHIIAWSLWRRAHQAAARQAHLKSKSQL